MASKDNNINSDKDYIFLIISIVVTLVSVFFSVKMLLPNRTTDEVSNIAEFSDIGAICELATLRSYYHNVAEFEKEPDGLYKYGYGKYGYKKMWLEYSGSVDLGIDASKVDVAKPDENGVVKISIPKAKVLNVHFDKESMQVPIADTGVLTSITVADEAEAFADAQKNMEETAKADEKLIIQAENRARQLIKAYVENIGNEMNVVYRVRWVEATEDNAEKGEETNG